MRFFLQTDAISVDEPTVSNHWSNNDIIFNDKQKDASALTPLNSYTNAIDRKITKIVQLCIQLS